MKKLLFFLLALPLFSGAQLLSGPISPQQIGRAPDSNQIMGSDEFGRAKWKHKSLFSGSNTPGGTYIANQQDSIQNGKFRISGTGIWANAAGGNGVTISGSAATNINLVDNYPHLGYNNPANNYNKAGPLFNVDNSVTNPTQLRRGPIFSVGKAFNGTIGNTVWGNNSIYLEHTMDMQTRLQLDSGRSFVYGNEDFPMTNTRSFFALGSNSPNVDDTVWITTGSSPTTGAMNHFSAFDLAPLHATQTFKHTGWVSNYVSYMEFGGSQYSNLDKVFHFSAGENHNFGSAFPDNGIADMYGFYVHPMKSSKVNNAWGFYQSGGSDKNYFAGNVMIGSTVNNGNKLQVTGAANITGALTVSTALPNTINSGDSMLVRAAGGGVKVQAIPAGGGGGGGTTPVYSSEFNWDGTNLSINLIDASKITGSKTSSFISNFNASARSAISLTTGGSGAATYNSSTGVLNIPVGGAGTTYNFSPTEFTVSGPNVSINQVSSSKITGLHSVATSGDYNALANKPTLFTVSGTPFEGAVVKYTSSIPTWGTDNTSGGGGSGTVNTGSAFRLAYYNGATASVSPWSAITASRALVSDGNGMPVASGVTSIELSYLSGATSNLQAQINAIASGEANTAASMGTGYSLVGAKTGVQLNFRSLVQGNGITLSQVDGGNSVMIAAEPNLDPHYTTLSSDVYFTALTPTNILFLDLPAGTWQVIGTGLFATPAGSNQSVSMEIVANSASWSTSVVHTQNVGSGSINESGHVSTLLDIAYPTTVALRVASFGGSTAVSSGRGTQLYAYRVGPSALAE